MKSIACAFLMLLSGSAALKISTKLRQPELLQLLASPGQGSTALGQLLMSSKNVATLCSSGTWQCEPCALIEGSKAFCEGTQFDINGLRNATDAWAQYWDLSRPVLMKKAMLDAMRQKVVETHRLYLEMVAGGLPQRMRLAAIDGLRFSYMVLWRPLCLSGMSSNFNGVPKEVEALEYLSNVVQQLRNEVGARVLVINYGSMLWEPEKTKQRIEQFLPEAGPLDMSFEPQLNIDIFPSNNWKVKGSISSYAVEHQDDTMTFRYNVPQQECDSYELDEEFAHLRVRYDNAVSFLRTMSM